MCKSPAHFSYDGIVRCGEASVCKRKVFRNNFPYGAVSTKGVQNELGERKNIE